MHMYMAGAYAYVCICTWLARMHMYAYAPGWCVCICTWLARMHMYAYAPGWCVCICTWLARMHMYAYVPGWCVCICTSEQKMLSTLSPLWCYPENGTSCELYVVIFIQLTTTFIFRDYDCSNPLNQHILRPPGIHSRNC